MEHRQRFDERFLERFGRLGCTDAAEDGGPRAHSFHLRLLQIFKPCIRVAVGLELAPGRLSVQN